MLKEFEIDLMEAFGVTKYLPEEITELQWLRLYACYVQWFYGETFCDVTLDPFKLYDLDVFGPGEQLERFVASLLKCPKPDNFVKEIKCILTNSMDCYGEMEL